MVVFLLSHFHNHLEIVDVARRIQNMTPAVYELLAELQKKHGKMTVQEMRTQFSWARNQAHHEFMRTRAAFEQLGVVKFFGEEIHLTKKGQFHAMQFLRDNNQLDEQLNLALSVLEQMQGALWFAIEEIASRVVAFSQKLKKATKDRRARLIKEVLGQLASLGLVTGDNEGRFRLAFAI